MTIEQRTQRVLMGNSTISVDGVEIPFGGAITFLNSGLSADPPSMTNESGQILMNREIRMRGAVEGNALFGCQGNPTWRAFATDVPGDTNNRFWINVNGSMAWGPGNGVLDCNFARIAAKRVQWTLDGIAAMNVVGTTASGYSANNFKSTGSQNYSVGIGGPTESTHAVADSFFVYDGLAGKMRIKVTPAGATTVCGGVAPPAGGSSAALLNLGSSAGFGIYYGSGVPTLSAGKGSLYLRSDGSGTGDRAYINTDGGTTWTALTTAA